MVEYTGIRIPKPVHEKLQEEKKDNETWGGCLERLMGSWTVQIDPEQADEIAQLAGEYAGEEVEGRLHDR